MGKIARILVAEGLMKTSGTFATWKIQKGVKPDSYTVSSFGEGPKISGEMSDLSSSELGSKLDSAIEENAKSMLELALKKESGDPLRKMWVGVKDKPREFKSVKPLIPEILKIADKGFLVNLVDGPRGWQVDKGPRLK